jgi:hypothetical protein
VRTNSIFILLGLSIALLTGCDQTSDLLNLKALSPSPVIEMEVQGSNPSQLLQDVIQKSKQPSATKFWFSSFVKTDYKMKTSITYLNGVVDMNANELLAKGSGVIGAYQYFRHADSVYMQQAGKWTKSKLESGDPIQLFGGYEAWLPFAEKAKQLQAVDVLGRPCHVLEFQLTGEQWLTLSPPDLFKRTLTNPFSEEGNRIAKNTQVVATLYVDQAWSQVIQQNVVMTVPLPNGGAMNQTFYVRFHKFDDPAIDTQLSKVRSIVQAWNASQ